uniref:Putative secreted protein n=1 Tax=Ixodes ricinus TaxID=34613 RepID=A0A6B0V5X8_IXORI
MSSILRIILTSWVARLICCFLLVRVSITCCSFMSLVPFPRQSMPRQGFPSLAWRAFTSVRVWIGARPEFSARAKGTLSRASANARNGYCSSVEILSACVPTARAQEISAAPPPYTIRLSFTRLRITHSASCRLRLASSTIILLPPRMKMVTALEFGHSSMTSMRSLVVPNESSRTTPAEPSLSALSSLKRGTMRPPVAMAISSISGPPTQRTAGSCLWSSRWLASSSKPHWQMTRLAPAAFTWSTISSNCCCS